MKLSLVLLSFFVMNAAALADDTQFTALHCVVDGRAAAFGGGIYEELLVHRVGEGPYEAVLYEAYATPNSPFPNATRRVVLGSELKCSKVAQGWDLTCSNGSTKFTLTLNRTVRSVIGEPEVIRNEVRWTGGQQDFVSGDTSALSTGICKYFE